MSRDEIAEHWLNGCLAFEHHLTILLGLGEDRSLDRPRAFHLGLGMAYAHQAAFRTLPAAIQHLIVRKHTADEVGGRDPDADLAEAVAALTSDRCTEYLRRVMRYMVAVSHQLSRAFDEADDDLPDKPLDFREFLANYDDSDPPR